MEISIELLEILIKYFEQLLQLLSDGFYQFIQYILSLLYELLEYLKSDESVALERGSGQQRPFQGGPRRRRRPPQMLPDDVWDEIFWVVVATLVFFFFLWWWFDRHPIPYYGNPPKPGTWRNPVFDWPMYLRNLFDGTYFKAIANSLLEWLRLQILGKNESALFALSVPSIKKLAARVKKAYQRIREGKKKDDDKDSNDNSKVDGSSDKGAPSNQN